MASVGAVQAACQLMGALRKFAAEPKSEACDPEAAVNERACPPRRQGSRIKMSGMKNWPIRSN